MFDRNARCTKLFLINHSLKQPSGEAKEKVKNIDLYIPPLNLTHHCEMKP